MFGNLLNLVDESVSPLDLPKITRANAADAIVTTARIWENGILGCGQKPKRYQISVHLYNIETIN